MAEDITKSSPTPIGDAHAPTQEEEDLIDDDLYNQILAEEDTAATSDDTQQSQQEDSTTNSLYDYQEGFSSGVHNKSLIEIISLLFQTDYPPPPLQFQTGDDQLIWIAFPTQRQLVQALTCMKCLHLFTLLMKNMTQREEFRNELLNVLNSPQIKQPFLKDFQRKHVDIIMHDMTQQVLLRPLQALSAYDDEQKPTHFFSLGDRILDELFQTTHTRGIPLRETSGGFVIEMSGVAGSGKTQLCLQLCLQCVMEERFGGLNARALYLHSERYPSERLNELIRARVRQYGEYCRQEGVDAALLLDEDYFLNRFLQKPIESTQELHSILCEPIDLVNNVTLLENEIDKKGIRLIVLDSIGMLYRGSHADKNSVLDRSNLLFTQVQQMKYLATKYKLLFIILNQVSSVFDEDDESKYRYYQSHMNEVLNYEDGIGSYIYNRGSAGGGHIYEDDAMDEVGDISQVRSYYRSTPSEKVKPTLGLLWSSLIDIRMFITKLNSRNIVIPSHHTTQQEKKVCRRENEVIYLRDYEKERPEFENLENSRQLHVIFSPFSATTSRSFIIDSFGVKGV